MLDKAKLGARYTCYECGTKFYDMNRPKATCPECSADQVDAPVRDIRSLLSGDGRKIPKPEPEPAPAQVEAAEGEEEEESSGDEEDDLFG